ncbi:ribosome maturation factor RimM [Companilactobacillus sp. RD055328]|uniref:ribosome maturation factor RimM n=1 Tax=Companilactobacillus sp. RD055328 TaxID=2916634 RepID=UPI001FC83689|nr:ribosome maturation factor RimM [Companilactobacillus sp. RD055328]GKQ42582.1 ribosome maturation factor RimM [Companilactobacillus sp. RD055328]
MEKLYNVGKIVGTHGIKGEVKIMSITDFPEQRYQKGNTLFLEDETQPMEIQSVRVHKGMYLIKFAEVKDLTEAEKYRNKILKATRQADDLGEREFYYSDIIGLTVVDNNLGELGKVSEIMSPGANDVWVVKSKKYKEVLIPYIPSVVLNVDLEDGKVIVELPEGLIN